MTDSMKFGPEWLRNMSAEPSSIAGSSSSSNNVAAMSGGALSIHSLGGGGGGSGGGAGSASYSHTAGSRNMFPEYRYGREEMLSLFDRNCVLPQILPSFKNLFVEKVQFPLALTPSSEDEPNTQSSTGSSSSMQSRPSWQQRSSGGFGLPSRGSGRGGTVDRGRMRGKSVYHTIYQRPGIYDDSSLSAMSIKPDRSWSDRNGTGDSVAVGVPPGNGSGGAGGGGGSSTCVDWNGTPGSSPRKDYPSHNRNMENWRRNRNEDGSGDGPTTGGGIGVDAAGWRSGGNGGGGGGHRWGRSTSWRDEESVQGGSGGGSGILEGSVQRSISMIGTMGTEHRTGKGTLGGSGTSSAPSATRQLSSKGNLSWSGPGADGDDNLPEWATENPSEIGGTFDSSGAFHGESAATAPLTAVTVRGTVEGTSTTTITPTMTTTTQQKQTDKFTDKEQATNTANATDELALDVVEDAAVPVEESDSSTISSSSSSGSKAIVAPSAQQLEEGTEGPTTATGAEGAAETTHKIPPGHGDISERFKEVADEVEKLIMDDDDGGVTAPIESQMETAGRLFSAVPVPQQPQLHPQPHPLPHPHQLLSQHPESVAELPLKPLAFSDQLAMQHQQLHQQQLQQQLHHQQLHQQQQQHLSVLPPPPPPPHVMNPKPNELWFYRDPQSNVQGPFSAIEMTEWYRAGYFNENLLVRRFSDTRFRALGDLIKICHGNMPFLHSNLLPTPMDLDNLQLGLTANKPSLLPSIALVGEPQPGQQAQVQIQVQPQTAPQQPQPHLHLHLGSIDEQQLKANVTAAADSLSAAVKGHMGAHSMDTSHMLTMRFQMLQDQYLQHQEYQIVSELSKNDCFQRMDAAQREAIVRSKVQMLVLPEYLSSFNGLSSSLAALNPVAGSQLYDAIAQQAKKDEQQPQPQSLPLAVPPHPQIYPGGVKGGNNFLDASDFITNAQLMHQQGQGQSQATPPQPQADQVQHAFGANPDTSKLNDLDLLNEYNLRMLLRGPAPTATQPQPLQPQLQAPQKQQMKPSAGVDFLTESQLLSGQNMMLPMWQQPSTQSAWPAMPNAPKVTLWDVATLEEEQSQQLLLQQQQQQQQKVSNHLEIEAALQQSHKAFEEVEGQMTCQMQQQSAQPEQPSNVGVVASQQPQQPQQQQQQQQQKEQPAVHASGKQVGKQQKQRDVVKSQSEPKISEEERRREQAEEKRRLKEERKRQQQEEEKRRQLLAEEEKQRQQQEERERQQQIQAQRRKALLGNPQAPAAASPATGTGNKASGAKNEQQQQQQQQQQQATTVAGAGGRLHGTSIAPWSLQTPNVTNAAPGLAEIQKAERRERRADQQRQQEQMDKQMRATAAAAAEANDAMLKWQASPSPAPVMSLVDIQAEEAKRLANELLEQQRRREHEQQQQQQQQTALDATINVGGGLSNIWGSSNKAWSGTCSSGSPAVSGAGLWDVDPVPVAAATKYQVSLGGGTPTAASVLAAGLPASGKSPSSQSQAKSSGILPSPRNLRKSQTLPTMQNALAKNNRSAGTGGGSQQQQQEKNNKAAPGKTASKGDEKKSGAKNQQQQQQQQQYQNQNQQQHSNNNATGDASSSKVSEYENEFTSWCMRSLDNMSTKVDVPTFVAFLQDLEAPYEVKDYVRIYLGEGKESSEFAKQFLERRSKYKSLQRAQNAHNDDMCKPAPAITPSCNDNGDNKNKQKKVKKNKMTKMDARILGFSVTAAEGRINVGGRDYVDAP